MICPKCHTPNDDTFQFCQECGLNFHNNQFATNQDFSNQEPPTVAFPVNFETNKNVPATQYQVPTGNLPPPNSQNNFPSNEFQTVVRPTDLHNNFNDSNQYVRKSSKVPLVLLGLLSIVLLGVVGYLVVPKLLTKAVILPDHFGLFTKNGEQFNELKMREFSNILTSRDELKNDSSLLTTEANPNLILYSDGQTIPVADLKLIRLDTIKEEGKIETWEYQIAPVEGNNQLKQIKVAAGLPKGKYAIANLKGNFDDGTHKLWAFQVANGVENAGVPQLISLNLKPTPVPTSTPQTPKKTVTPTPEATPDDEVTDTETTETPDEEIGICNDNNVVVRRSPIISESNKIGRLDRGQKVVILKYSSGTETWNGVTARWVFVRTPKGKTGWVFGAFIN